IPGTDGEGPLFAGLESLAFRPSEVTETVDFGMIRTALLNTNSLSGAPKLKEFGLITRKKPNEVSFGTNSQWPGNFLPTVAGCNLRSLTKLSIIYGHVSGTYHDCELWADPRYHFPALEELDVSLLKTCESLFPCSSVVGDNGNLLRPGRFR